MTRRRKRKPQLAYDDSWITLKPNGPDVKGSHVLLGEGGEVKAGLGGKFTGKHISQVKGKWAQAQGGGSAAGAASGASVGTSGGGASGGSQGGEGGGGGENKPARNPKIPQDQSQLTQPMKILKETPKAYAVANPAYESAKTASRLP